MGVKIRQNMTALIKVLLGHKKPRDRVMIEEIGKFFDLNDDKAWLLAEKFRSWHIVRYYDISMRGRGGYVVTDYAQDILYKRTVWEENNGKE